MKRDDGRRIVKDVEISTGRNALFIDNKTAEPIFFKHHIIFGFLGKFSDGIHFIRKVKEILKHDFNVELVGTVTAHLLNAALNNELKTESFTL